MEISPGSPLADPAFHQSAEVELLLGAAVYSAILLNGVHRGLTTDPIAQETRLGWIVTDTTQCQSLTPIEEFPIQRNSLCAVHQEDSMLAEVLRRFWELEEPPRSTLLSPENQMYERLFVEGHRRLVFSMDVMSSIYPVRQLSLY